jgi:membrane associated rhomboid family serine protease
MFPLNAARRHKGTPYVTYLLIVVNILVFFWELTLSPNQLYNAFMDLSTVPCQIGTVSFLEIMLDAFRSMYFHGGWLHLMGNMAFLVVFGIHVEEYYGSRLFFLFYTVAGFGSAFLHALFNLGQCIPVVGASGAIFGVMGGFLLLYPGVRIHMLSLFSFKRFVVPLGTFKIPAFTLLGGYFVINLFDGLLALSGAETATSGVAVWGHIGGFIAGLIFTFVATAFKAPPPVDPLAHLDD